MRRSSIVVALLLIAGFLALAYTSVAVVVWDGRFLLTVRVSSESGLPRWVRCETFFDPHTPEYILDHLDLREIRHWRESADPFTGDPLVVTVPVSGRTSLSGRELRRTQCKYLAVVAELPDGRHVGKVLEIPDGRLCRDVSVVLP